MNILTKNYIPYLICNFIFEEISSYIFDYISAHLGDNYIEIYLLRKLKFDNKTYLYQ